MKARGCTDIALVTVAGDHETAVIPAFAGAAQWFESQRIKSGVSSMRIPAMQISGGITPIRNEYKMAHDIADAMGKLVAGKPGAAKRVDYAPVISAVSATPAFAMVTVEPIRLIGPTGADVAPGACKVFEGRLYWMGCTSKGNGVFDCGSV